MPENPWSFGGAWGYPVIAESGFADIATISSVWTFEGSPWGYPIIRKTGTADAVDILFVTIWTFDSEHWGLPYIQRTGLADKAVCPSIWIYVDGVHFDYPFIRKTRLADPYEQAEGIYKLYHGSDKVTRAFIGTVEVKRVYYRGEIVFEKG